MRTSSSCAAALLIAALLCPLSASALGDDAVYVLPYGGVEALWTLDLDEQGAQPRALDLGAERIRDAADGPTTITDVKPLPDGALLLTDVGGQGVLWLSADRTQTQLLYKAPSPALFPLAAASVVRYGPSGLPRVLLIGDTTTSSAILYDVAEQRALWTQSAFLPSGRGFVSQIISQPDDRAWIGMWWRGEGVTGVDRITRDAAGTALMPPARIANRAHDGAPSALTVLDTLDEVRDLQGLPDGGVLITGRFIIIRVNANGTARWQLPILDQPGLAGELASARLLPSGKLAVATLEPGEWTRPHPNHRVHWLVEPAADGPTTLLASSGPLVAAPRHIEPAIGGGTGTLGWSGPPDEEQPADLALLALDPALASSPASLKQGDWLTLVAGLRSLDGASVAVERAQLKAARSEDCGALAGLPTRTLSERVDTTIAPGAPLDLGGMLRLDEGWQPGAWCLFIEVSAGTARRTFAQTSTIRVLPARAPVFVDELEFTRYGDDMDAPDMGMEPAPPSPKNDGDDGCGCATPAQQAPWPLWALLALPALLGYRRR
jgi:MYXO-CTERM domain-containing protein